MRLLQREPNASPPRDAVIDIGSNSVRLVVYQGPPRLPAVLFNEKVMAGLGRSLARTGAIDGEAMRQGTEALGRFAAVARAMKVGSLRTVATAAVRDASNGKTLLDAAAALDLDVELLSGEDEAVAAGYGVISGIPQADGIVGDLGGGSLELVRVTNGEVRERASFPLGVLRIADWRKNGKAFDRQVARLLEQAGWTGRGRGLPLYLVGGSWRALARLDMALSGYPLPIIHQYGMTPDTIGRLVRTVPHLSKPRLKSIPGLSSGRAATLADAAALLGILLRRLGSSTTIVSTFGLRDGLLYQKLPAGMRSLDPLIVAAREEGRVLGRFPEHGDLLNRWIAPLFSAEDATVSRIRHAACLLADTGWRANPEFRAERGLEVALHGQWVAIEPQERAQLAQTLFTALCGATSSPDPLPRLAQPAALKQAMAWGLAIRLGQRLSAGLPEPLDRSVVSMTGGDLTLTAQDRALLGEAVLKRHVALAEALMLRPVLQ